MANARREVVENIGTKISELTESLVTLSGPVNPGSSELAANISVRINELSEIVNKVVTDPRRAKVAQD